ncbi:class I SAM-dependent methyltransferase [Alicyclobacillus sp. SO9]|uniref:class I SAM-dependent methyltransferase n=1 Tax=Alicyclobacillus sp. SO9 TaxID=2665646 RepID=UPI00351C66B1
MNLKVVYVVNGGNGMVHRGSDFYDQPSVFSTYMQHRTWSQNPNDTIEKPILAELIGNVRNCAILDLGCGNADFGLSSLQLGCRRYVGLEGSKNMAQSGRNTLEGTSGKIILSSIEDWNYPEASFDLVVSRLALHYVENVEECFRNVYKTLVPGGRFVFQSSTPCSLLVTEVKKAPNEERTGSLTITLRRVSVIIHGLVVRWSSITAQLKTIFRQFKKRDWWSNRFANLTPHRLNWTMRSTFEG